jgi:hypothetical protein
MSTRNFCITVFLIICLLPVFIFYSPAHAKNWYDYYTGAITALKERDWKTAIALLEKAIAEEPKSFQRTYGMRTVGYYPYLFLGRAYFATGNVEAAYQYCEQEKLQGVAPQQDVDECLAVASKFLEKTPLPIFPTPTPLPPTPIPQQDTSLSIKLISAIPAETERDKITIEGIAIGANGIKEVRVSRENLGVTQIKTLYFSNSREQETFSMTRILEDGSNEFTIEVIDTKGQVGKPVVFTVFRKPAILQPPTPISELPEPMPELPTPMPELPTPMPELPTPIPRSDNPPSITLISAIPAETDRETLEIQGIALDDNGIQDVKVSVRKPGTRSFIVTSAKMAQQKFNADVQLELGQNEIVVEAIDTIGQTTKQVFTVARKTFSKPEVTIAAEASPKPIRRQGDVYGVIIGIGNYQDTRIPALRFTVNDAQGLYDLLTNPNYGGIPKENIKLILNQDATYQNIKGAIGKWLSQQAKEEDTVIIYYSGHGAPEAQDTYWVTYNADIDDLYTTALSNNEIADMLSRIRSKRVITFLDSCYSAATVKRKNLTRNVQTEIPWDKFSGQGRVTISASDGKQLSLELDEYQHGVFTYYLLEGLQGKADKNLDGVIEVDEIWDYIKYQVTDTARKAGNPQTPVFQGSLTAGIPLTFNLAFIQQQQQLQVLQKEQEKLTELFKQGLIQTRHYNCAYKMLKSGTSDPLLEGLLSGEIDPEVFNDSFDCHF